MKRSNRDNDNKRTRGVLNRTDARCELLFIIVLANRRRDGSKKGREAACVRDEYDRRCRRWQSATYWNNR